MTLPLPPDNIRCHDKTCPEREQCLRWLDRTNPEATIHSVLWRKEGQPCVHRLPSEP